MTDIDILSVERLDFQVFPLPWPFAADRRTEIEDYFTHLRREKPQLWNGRVLLLRDFEISGATLQGTMFETDFASFIAWRDWGFPDRDVHACFAMGALLSRDGAFLLGLMNAHTAGGRSPRRPVSALRMLQLIPGSLCSRRRESWSSRYSASASRRARCAQAFSLICKKKPYLNFPTFTLFATPPTSNRACLHSSARFFCIFGLATASDDVGFCSGDGMAAAFAAM